MDKLPKDKKIILFDGVCNLCNSSIQLIIKNDTNDVFRFVSLQSELGQEILTHIGVDTKSMDSILLYEPGIAYYYKSEAVLKIANEMKGWYSILGYLSFTGNSFDFLYNFVAKNRYKWFGKKESCMIPTAELKAKFL